jgi:enoyl-CoA hydratase
MNAEPEILFDRHGSAAIVTLNRPHALNAVTHGMVRQLAAKLEAWRQQPSVSRVIIKATGPRAFSAGGDIRALHDLGRTGRQGEALRFWRDEYALNAVIKTYPKPYVALIDGIVMGGGVGVSIHGSHRVAGDKFAFAMPEVGIGFFPDVGATWLLPRLPGEIGTYLALTGERLATADAVGAGIANYHVPSARFADLLEALCSAAPVDGVVAAFAERPGPARLLNHHLVLDDWFAVDEVETILDRLDREGTKDAGDAALARQTASTIRGKSPTSLKIALSQLRQGRCWSFADSMKAEFRIVSRIIYGHDFYEGVRALILDKDNAPRWAPASLEEVSEAEVNRYFAPVEDELVLP